MAAPTRVVSGGTILATDINQYADRVNRQSGQTEVRKYKIAGGGYTTGASICCYLPSTSLDATPGSVTIDTADQSPSGNLNTPGTFNLTSCGVAIIATVSAASSNAFCAGNCTFNY